MRRNPKAIALGSLRSIVLALGAFSLAAGTASGSIISDKLTVTFGGKSTVMPIAEPGFPPQSGFEDVTIPVTVTCQNNDCTQLFKPAVLPIMESNVNVSDYVRLTVFKTGFSVTLFSDASLSTSLNEILGSTFPKDEVLAGVPEERTMDVTQALFSLSKPNGPPISVKVDNDLDTVPEPSTGALLLFGLLATAALGRKLNLHP